MQGPPSSGKGVESEGLWTHGLVQIHFNVHGGCCPFVEPEAAPEWPVETRPISLPSATTENFVCATRFALPVEMWNSCGASRGPMAGEKALYTNCRTTRAEEHDVCNGSKKNDVMIIYYP